MQQTEAQGFEMHTTVVCTCSPFVLELWPDIVQYCCELVIWHNGLGPLACADVYLVWRVRARRLQGENFIVSGLLLRSATAACHVSSYHSLYASRCRLHEPHHSKATPSMHTHIQGSKIKLSRPVLMSPGLQPYPTDRR